MAMCIQVLPYAVQAEDKFAYLRCYTQRTSQTFKIPLG